MRWVTEISSKMGRREGLVVERRTPEREVEGSISQRSPFCILMQDTFTPPPPKKKKKIIIINK